MMRLNVDNLTKLLYLQKLESRPQDIYMHNIYLGKQNMLLPIWSRGKVKKGMLKEFSKGEGLFFGLEREPMDFDVDMKYLFQGFSFYEDLSKDETSKLSYAWGWTDPDTLMEVFDLVNIGRVKIQKERNFLALSDLNFDETLFDKMSFNSRVSFLFGGALLRGDFDVVGDSLVNLKIFWPVYEDSKKGILSQLKHKLGEEIILVKEHITLKGKNDIVQWSIDDEELLNLLGKWLGLNSTNIDTFKGLTSVGVISDNIKYVKRVIYS